MTPQGQHGATGWIMPDGRFRSNSGTVSELRIDIAPPTEVERDAARAEPYSGALLCRPCNRWMATGQDMESILAHGCCRFCHAAFTAGDPIEHFPTLSPADILEIHAWGYELTPFEVDIVVGELRRQLGMPALTPEA